MKGCATSSIRQTNAKRQRHIQLERQGVNVSLFFYPRGEGGVNKVRGKNKQKMKRSLIALLVIASCCFVTQSAWAINPRGIASGMRGLRRVSTLNALTHLPKFVSSWEKLDPDSRCRMTVGVCGFIGLTSLIGTLVFRFRTRKGGEKESVRE